MPINGSTPRYARSALSLWWKRLEPGVRSDETRL